MYKSTRILVKNADFDLGGLGVDWKSTFLTYFQEIPTPLVHT
jgi:hypothetical protein